MNQSATGSTVIKVTIDNEIKLNPIITTVLISVAALYFIVMVVHACRKSRDDCDSSSNDNYESIDEYTDSEAYDRYATRESGSSSISKSSVGHSKDTMSHSSFEIVPPFKKDRHLSLKRKSHQRNVSKLIFNQSMSETDSL